MHEVHLNYQQIFLLVPDFRQTILGYKILGFYSMTHFWMQKAGLDGASRDTVLLLSMTVTTDINGLSAGSS
jgi:hypothetical protein